MALDPDFRGGITVAAADLTGDNKAEVAVGAGPTGGSHINVYNPLTGSPISGPLSSFFAFGTANRDGVFLGADALAGDVNADGTPDLAGKAREEGMPESKKVHDILGRRRALREVVPKIEPIATEYFAQSEPFRLTLNNVLRAGEREWEVRLFEAAAYFPAKRPDGRVVPDRHYHHSAHTPPQIAKYVLGQMIEAAAAGDRAMSMSCGILFAMTNRTQMQSLRRNSVNLPRCCFLSSVKRGGKIIS